MDKQIKATVHANLTFTAYETFLESVNLAPFIVVKL